MANIPVYAEGIDMNLHMSELNTSLQQNISDNGMVMPSQPTTTIGDLSTQMPDGTIWYDSTSNELKAQVNGSVVVIQTV